MSSSSYILRRFSIKRYWIMNIFYYLFFELWLIIFKYILNIILKLYLFIFNVVQYIPFFLKLQWVIILEYFFYIINFLLKIPIYLKGVYFSFIF